MQEKWLMPFLKNSILAVAMLGGHQIFAFLALIMKSQFFIKASMIAPMLSIYFALRSLEIFLNKNLKSKIVLFIIVAFIFHTYFLAGYIPFISRNFYILQDSTKFSWLFMAIFFYWHICWIFDSRFLKDNANKKIIIFYSFAIMDTAFLLSLAYATWGYSKYSNDMCIALPSIWCTFTVIQALFMPFFLAAIPKIANVPNYKMKQSITKTIIYIFISLALLYIFGKLMPVLIGCLSLKFVFQ